MKILGLSKNFPCILKRKSFFQVSVFMYSYEYIIILILKFLLINVIARLYSCWAMGMCYPLYHGEWPCIILCCKLQIINHEYTQTISCILKIPLTPNSYPMKEELYIVKLPSCAKVWTADPQNLRLLTYQWAIVKTYTTNGARTVYICIIILAALPVISTHKGQLEIFTCGKINIHGNGMSMYKMLGIRTRGWNDLV